MPNSNTSPKVKYLPFDQFHLAPVSSLTPNGIKKAAKKMSTDREWIRLQTAQNFICKSLGFRAGMAGFKTAYRDELRPFMDKHRLDTLTNLVNNDIDDRLFNFTHRQIADRLFHDDSDMPTRVFTGIGIDAYVFLQFALKSDDYFVSSTLLSYSSRKLEKPEDDEVRYVLDPSFNHLDGPKEPGMGEDMFRPFAYRVSRISNSEQCIEYGYVSSFGNMLGDQCLDYADGDHPVEVVPLIYNENANPIKATEEERLSKAGQLLRSILLDLKKGWLDVIPYTKNLVFLRGPDGQYDFVFRGMRDERFEHNPHHPYLKNDDIPNTGSDYDFKRWLYFPSNNKSDTRRPYSGWLERDEHEAEKMFYEVGHSAGSNPQDVLLKNYLTDKGEYVPLAKRRAGRTDGFHKCQINGEDYYVSDLVTQGQFTEFMNANWEYQSYSREPDGVDAWQTVNCDDKSLPASVTWYDAMAYAAWISKNKGHHAGPPVRLPTEEEYRSIASPPIPMSKDDYFASYIDCGFGCPDDDDADDDNVIALRDVFVKAVQKRLCRFESTDGATFPSYPNCWPGGDEFQKLLFKYNTDAMVWKQSRSGPNFLHSHYFGEWLQPKGAAINSILLCSMSEISGRIDPPTDDDIVRWGIKPELSSKEFVAAMGSKERGRIACASLSQWTPLIPRTLTGATRARYSATSTGKDKSFKIGFRLIYKAS